MAFQLFILLLLLQSAFSANIGDSCQSDNIAGKCSLLKDCPAVEETLEDEQPDICGFKGLEPIICCVEKTKPKPPPGQISREKCKQYSDETVYDIMYTSFNLNAKPNKISKCTIVQTTLVVGGEDAKPKEFPHMALLGYRGDADRIWACGGTLISNNFVVTAAHCIADRNYGMVNKVRLGDLHITNTTEPSDPKDFNIAEIIKHPSYKFPARYHDIALLKLAEIVKFNDYIRPACLHTKFEIPTQRYIATGWGLTQAGADKGSDHLQKVIVDKFTNEECSNAYERNRKLKLGITSDTQLCAGGHDEEKDTCQGDSGGPLQIYDLEVHCMYDIVGVTSFGIGCGIKKIPGVYTRVSNYIEWIENNVWN